MWIDSDYQVDALRLSGSRVLGGARWTRDADPVEFGAKPYEVRLTSDVKTTGWMTTEYDNQSSPSTFYAVGPLMSQ